jgi:hypothetical protein
VTLDDGSPRLRARLYVAAAIAAVALVLLLRACAAPPGP